MKTKELAALKRALKAGKRAPGLGRGLWTSARVVRVMESLFGVQYHPARGKGGRRKAQG